uniref:Auxin-responsive protein n=1 Tax=Galium aparine TaxID=29788 RepID=A0A896WAE5_GALAP|nr:IAA4 [Galium aparine]
MEGLVAHHENGLNFKATELRLGLPGSEDVHQSEKEQSASASSCVKNCNKRSLNELAEETCKSGSADVESKESAPAPKAQIVGWPPVRSYRKNVFQAKKAEADQAGCFIKVSMDGAPYLRKIDIKGYKGYAELLKALENMFKLTIGRNLD